MTGNTSRRESSEEIPGAGLGITDAYFILFRRKWLIFACSLLGFLAAALIWRYYPRVYESQAKLLVRYVVEDRSSEAVRTDSAMRRTTETRPESVINSEAEILGSFDIARDAAIAVGPARILGDLKSGDSATDAASEIRGNLTVDPQKGGNVITLRYRHPDAEIPPLVLQQIIAAYERKHFAIHRNAGAFDEFLTQLIDHLKMQLKATEEDLKKVRRPLAGFSSIQDAKKAYLEQINKARQEVFSTEAELAQRRAIWAELRKQTPTNAPPTNGPVAASQSKVDEYRNVRLQVELYEQRDRELLRDFTSEYPLVKGNRTRLEEVRRIKERMERENPSLVFVPATITSVDGRAVSDSTTAAAEIVALEVKYSILTNQMAQIRSDLKKVDDVETEVTELERRKALEESQYISFTKTLEQAKFDQMLGSGKVANIRTVESPLPPYRNAGKLNKLLMIAICGGVGGGLALAFFLELVVDRSLKRPKEIEAVLGAPLFLTVPRLRIPREQRPHANGRPAALPPPDNVSSAPDGAVAAAVRAARKRSALDPYCEALRDRLISHFEIRQMTHKPKMVGVTGCLPGAGVTSIAAGLASSLSETGDGNVLLVEMNGENGAARAFYRGKAVCGLDELLAGDSLRNGLLQDNLCVVSGLDETGRPQAVMSRKFSHLVPKLKASDYDYIIFDLPPVSQTSVTGRVSRFMDMLFLVVESEQTDRDLAKRALHLLEDSKAQATVVLNKYKSRVPQWLHREFQ